MSSQPEPTAKPRLYSGEFHLSLDEKKRLTIPARWRTGLLEELFVIKSPKRGCLSAMPQEVLQAIGEKAASLAHTVADHQAFKDQFFASAVICPVDGQGRMVLADDLCRFAGIKVKSEVVLAGSADKFDIWNPETWQRQQQASVQNYEKILGSLGL
jgi:MraZ protein